MCRNEGMRGTEFLLSCQSNVTMLQPMAEEVREQKGGGQKANVSDVCQRWVGDRQTGTVVRMCVPLVLRVLPMRQRATAASCGSAKV